MQGALLLNFQPGIRNCMAMALFRLRNEEAMTPEAAVRLAEAA